jgi:hypothetical protein
MTDGRLIGSYGWRGLWGYVTDLPHARTVCGGNPAKRTNVRAAFPHEAGRSLGRDRENT